MPEIVRYCANCNWDRPLEQHHVGCGGCPDASDGICPEWFCLTCGAAVILGEVPAPFGLPRAVGIRDRVA